MVNRCGLCDCVCVLRYLVVTGMPEKILDYLVMFHLELGFDGE